VCQVILLEHVPFVLWLYGVQLSSHRAAVSLVAITLSLRGLPFDHVAMLVDLVEVFDSIESHGFCLVERAEALSWHIGVKKSRLLHQDKARNLALKMFFSLIERYEDEYCPVIVSWCDVALTQMRCSRLIRLGVVQ
jgi:hypothetical protein